MKDKIMKLIRENEQEFNRICMLIDEADKDCSHLDFMVALNPNKSHATRVSCFIKGLESSKITCNESVYRSINEEILNRKPSTVERACKLIQGRANIGQVKYGVSIDRDDLTASDWAQHALEEMLDGAQYLIRLKDEMEALQKENAELKRNQKQSLTDEISLLKNIIKNGLTIQDYLASKEKELDLIEQLDK
jgi:hypothetical protein